MIFMPDSIGLILSGRKTQTRRPVKPGEAAQSISAGGEYGPLWRADVFSSGVELLGVWMTLRADGFPCVPPRIKWQAGRTYTICPGRGKKAVGRFTLRGIRCERVRDVTDIGAALEGICYDPDRAALCYGSTLLEGKTGAEAYLSLWRTLYPKSDLTELCWVLSWDPREVVRVREDKVTP